MKLFHIAPTKELTNHPDFGTLQSHYILADDADDAIEKWIIINVATEDAESGEELEWEIANGAGTVKVTVIDHPVLDD